MRRFSEEVSHVKVKPIGPFKQNGWHRLCGLFLLPLLALYFANPHPVKPVQAFVTRGGFEPPTSGL